MHASLFGVDAWVIWITLCRRWRATSDEKSHQLVWIVSLSRIQVEAEQVLARAEGQGQAEIVRAEAEAKAQELLRKTITSEMIDLRAIEKWDGTQPLIVGDGAAILALGPIKKAAGR